MLEILLVFLLLIYAAAHVAIGTLWVLDRYYRLRGSSNLLAPQWSLVDLWFAAHLVVFATLTMAGMMAFWIGFGAALLLPTDQFTLRKIWHHIQSSEPLMWLGLFGVLIWQNAAFAAVSVWYIIGRYQIRVDQIGLRWNWRLAKPGILWGFAAFLVTPLIEGASHLALRLFLGAGGFERLTSWESQTDLLERFFDSLQHGAVLVAFLAVAVVAAPLGEELFFRGFVFNLLRYRWNYKGALWSSSALFAALHGSVTNFLPLLVIGALLAYLYHRTGSLWSSVLMHATFNLLSTLAALIIGG